MPFGKKPRPVWDRMEEQFIPEPNSGCWLWTGPLSAGYGNINIAGKSRRAHRVSYELLVGPIPEGKEIDHKCRIRRCINPAHLEPVTRSVNILRGKPYNKRKLRELPDIDGPKCKHGHPQTDDNSYVNADGVRCCRRCAYLSKLNYERRRRARGGLRSTDRKPPPPQTHCVRGHPLSAENLYVSPMGHRACRKCNALSQQRYRSENGSVGHGF